MCTIDRIKRLGELLGTGIIFTTVGDALAFIALAREYPVFKDTPFTVSMHEVGIHVIDVDSGKDKPYTSDIRYKRCPSGIVTLV